MSLKQNALENLRAEIDALDDELSTLLDKRLEIASKIALIKQESPIYRPKREQEILKRLLQRDFKYLNEEALTSIYTEIFKVSKSFQESVLKALKK
ncbi:chorismate mutase [Helicobacter cetorum]|uniref:chorismate mutase n=1 Tax=Helicobacter cetorum (strain ATCC BAA-540 / CCUG 52418 / MIT 99-5656) TaxID=1163745 RepID=I0ETY9_HELCM|nr:chorismate mutase [Helicobacter cetorum MIT 99-5656]